MLHALVQMQKINERLEKLNREQRSLSTRSTRKVNPAALSSEIAALEKNVEKQKNVIKQAEAAYEALQESRAASRERHRLAEASLPFNARGYRRGEKKNHYNAMDKINKTLKKAMTNIGPMRTALRKMEEKIAAKKEKLNAVPAASSSRPTKTRNELLANRGIQEQKFRGFRNNIAAKTIRSVSAAKKKSNKSLKKSEKSAAFYAEEVDRVYEKKGSEKAERYLSGLCDEFAKRRSQSRAPLRPASPSRRRSPSPRRRSPSRSPPRPAAAAASSSAYNNLNIL